MGGFFNIDDDCRSGRLRQEFGVVVDELEQIGEEMGCVIKAQREDIFDKMHRI